jgi:hypothetical protein
MKFRSTTLISLFIVACIAIIVSINSLKWVNKPFSGFLLMKNRIVASIGLPHWPGVADGKIFQAKIIAVNGQKIQRAEQIRDILQHKPPGEKISYLFIKGDQLFTREIPSSLFPLLDFFLLFGSYLFNGLIYALIGLGVYQLSPGSSASKALFIFCLTSCLWALTACDLYSPYWLFRFHIIFEAFMPAALIHAAFTFPERKRFIQKNSFILFIPYFLAFIISIVYEILLYSHSGYVFIHNLSVFYLGMAIIIFIVSFVLTYMKSQSALIKQKIRIVILGTCIAFFLPALTTIFSSITGGEIAVNTIALTAFIFPLALGYATVRHNLFEADVIIQRSLYYLSLTSLIVVIYLSMAISSNMVFRGSDIVKSPTFSLFFIIFILFLLNSLRERAQKIVDRLFFRAKFDYRAIIQKVSSDLTTILNLNQIAERIAQTLSEVLFAETSLVMLLEPKINEYRVFKAEGFENNGLENLAISQKHPLIERIKERKREITYYDFEQSNEETPVQEAELDILNRLQAQLILPIFFKEELEGLLILGRKKSGIFYSSEDLGLLKILTTEGAISVANARSYEEVQSLNIHLEDKVKQRTEELNKISNCRS